MFTEELKIEKHNINKMAILLTMIYRFNPIVTEIQGIYFVDLQANP